MSLDAVAGPLARARDKLCGALAASATFRAWCGVSESTAAMSHVHFSALPGPEDGKSYGKEEIAGLLPWVEVYTTRFQGQRDSVGAGFEYRHSGTICLHLFGPVDESTREQPSECGRKFDNILDGIMADLEAVAGTSAGLAIERIDMPEEPDRGRLGEEAWLGDLFRVDLLVSWSD